MGVLHIFLLRFYFCYGSPPKKSCSSLLPCRRELCLLTLTLLDINKGNRFLVTTVPAADMGGHAAAHGGRDSLGHDNCRGSQMQILKQAWVSRGQRSAVLKSV